LFYLSPIHSPSICIGRASDALKHRLGVNGDVARTIPFMPHSTNHLVEMTMKTIHALAFAALIAFAVPVANADDAVAAKPQPARTAAVAPVAQPAPVKLSQQEKMKFCAKEATGKKGAERKAFMKSCLSKKA